MTDFLVVLLNNTVIGILARLPGNRLAFEYDDDYRNRPGATPLSVSMPIPVRSHSHHVITPWLWNLLPDNDIVLSRWAREFQISASSPFSFLATKVGLDCAGAVRFVDPDRLEQAISRPGKIIWLTTDEVAERLRDLKTDSTAWLGRNFTGQFSLAGAQAKTALYFKDGRWGLPLGAAATTHILKPAVVGLDDHDLNEHLCLDAARRAGLVTVRTHVERFGEESVIVVDRYDRREDGGEVTRIHQEDLCQALGLPPTRKYQNEQGPSPGQISELFRRVMSPRVADDAVRRFIDALAWNWLIGGTDAHAKNYSLLLAGGQVRLAPLYDIASVLPYGTHERALRFAMKIGGDYRVFFYQNTWGKAADELGVSRDDVIHRVRALTDKVAAAFADAATAPDVVALGRTLPGRLVDVIAERAKRCAQLLDANRGTEE